MASRSNYQSYTMTRQHQIQQMMSGKFRETLKPDDFDVADLAPRQEDVDHEAYMQELEHREAHEESPVIQLQFSKQTIVSPTASAHSQTTHSSHFSQQLASAMSSGSQGSRGGSRRASAESSAFAAFTVVGGGVGGVGSPLSQSLLPQAGSTATRADGGVNRDSTSTRATTTTTATTTTAIHTLTTDSDLSANHHDSDKDNAASNTLHHQQSTVTNASTSTATSDAFAPSSSSSPAPPQAHLQLHAYPTTSASVADRSGDTAGFYHANRYAEAAKPTDKQCRVFLDFMDGKKLFSLQVQLAPNCTALRLIQQTLAIAFDEDMGTHKDKPEHLNDASLYQVYIGEIDGEVDEDFPALGQDAIVSKQQVDAFIVRLSASAAAALAGNTASVRGSALGSTLSGAGGGVASSYLGVKTPTHHAHTSSSSKSSPGKSSPGKASPGGAVRSKTPAKSPVSPRGEKGAGLEIKFSQSSSAAIHGPGSPSIDMGDYNRTQDFTVGNTDSRADGDEDDGTGASGGAGGKREKVPHATNPYGGSVRGGNNRDHNSGWNKLFRFS